MTLSKAVSSATRAAIHAVDFGQSESAPFQVVVDPEVNEFCLVHRDPLLVRPHWHRRVRLAMPGPGNHCSTSCL